MATVNQLVRKPRKKPSREIGVAWHYRHVTTSWYVLAYIQLTPKEAELLHS